MSYERKNVARAARSVTCSLATVATTVVFVACVKTEGTSTTSDSNASATSTAASTACPGDNGGITLPAGFCATVFADTIGHARHIVVNSNGVVYANTWSGQYYQTPAHPGGFLVAMRDTNNDGRADIITRFGPDSLHGSFGGTGIGIYKGSLYAEQSGANEAKIVRYALATNFGPPSQTAETIVSTLPVGGDHPMHPFGIDSSGNMYVDLGSASNSCQAENRKLESPGRKPCTELRTRGGIWRYDANRTNQRFSPAERFATGIRNGEGIAVGPGGAMYSTQHGRDQLYDNWPKLYTPQQGQSNPAEELLLLGQGKDYGWPMCYFDSAQAKLVLAPEYGGDGGKAVGECASKTPPVGYYPAHWAPDDLLFYTGASFPAHYRGGAFIAFHGSWNRAPAPQGGYQVDFVPFSGANPAKPDAFEKFADGFAGGKMQPDAAAHRPAGLAQGPDGSLYITDDKAGRVWKVVYKGPNK